MQRNRVFVSSKVSQWVGFLPLNREEPIAPLSIEYIVVAGGGGGGAYHSGGGGAGGYRTNAVGFSSGGGSNPEGELLGQKGTNYSVTI
jgi:hypothetical protein